MLQVVASTRLTTSPPRSLHIKGAERTSLIRPLTFLDSFGAFISSRAMAVCSRIPGFRRPPTANPPKYKAVLIGINYTSPTSGNEQGRRSLQGPVNDAKEIKKILIGGVSAVALPLTSSTPPLAEVFRYKEKDIFLMTDEEANRDTTHWPSEENIVSLCIRIIAYSRMLCRVPFLRSSTIFQIRALQDLVRDASSGDAFVFFCGLLPLFFLVLFDYFFLRRWSLRTAARDHRPQRSRWPR